MYNNNMPDLFVIIPAFNADTTLHDCLQALQHQTIGRHHYHIIVVDDGSTDQTADIGKTFADTYLFQKNQGPAAARNAGASYAAKGQYGPDRLIFFTDADCIPEPDWLEQMSAPFTNPHVAAVKGAYRTEQQSLIARFAQVEFEERFALLASQPQIDMVDTYSAGFRLTVFEKMGGFDTRFPVANNEDTELSYRMSSHGLLMVFNPLAVVRHVNHPDTASRYFRLKFSRGYWRIMVYRMFPGKMFKDSYTPQTLKVQIIALAGAGAGLLTSPVMPRTGSLLAITFSLVFLSQTLPFVLFAQKKDHSVALMSPLLLALRAVAIGSGACWGILSLPTGRQFSNTAENSKGDHS